MFRKVSFIWASHFSKLLCHWLEKSHFLTPSGSVHLFSVPSPAGSQLARHHESLIPLLGPWVCFISNTQVRTCNTQVRNWYLYKVPKFVKSSKLQITFSLFLMMTNNDLGSSPTLFPLFIFPLTVHSPFLYSPSLYIPLH